MVCFDFVSNNYELLLIVFSVLVFFKKWVQGMFFDQIQLMLFISIGFYLIESYDIGCSIIYKCNLDYWGKDVLVWCGMFNFECIVYCFYKDDLVWLEVFKVGEFDVVVEYSVKNWVCSYIGLQFCDGCIVKKEFKYFNGVGMQGFVMNLCCDQFKDVWVCQVIGLVLDYEWMNCQLFYGQYMCIYFFFNNSQLVVIGELQGDELVLLKLLQVKGLKVDLVVFGFVLVLFLINLLFFLCVNLCQVCELLVQVGWVYCDGVVCNVQGVLLFFEIFDDQSLMLCVISVFVCNLCMLGIDVVQCSVDYVLVVKCMEDFDFDMISVCFFDISSFGNELFDMFGLCVVDEKGFNNVWGLKDLVVDQLVQMVVVVDMWVKFIVVVCVLDCVLLYKYIVVLYWYFFMYCIVYQNCFGILVVVLLYYQVDFYVIGIWWEEKV